MGVADRHRSRAHQGQAAWGATWATSTAPLYCDAYAHKHTKGEYGDACTKKIRSPKGSKHYIDCFGKLVTEAEVT